MVNTNRTNAKKQGPMKCAECHSWVTEYYYSPVNGYRWLCISCFNKEQEVANAIHY